MVVVVSPQPFRGLILCILDAFDDVLVKPFKPNRPVVPLDVGVLLRLSGLDVLDRDLVLLSPFSHCFANVFGSIVMVLRVPSHSMMRSRLRMTRSARGERSASIPNPSRLKSFSTFSSRKAPPSPG